jgi:hypothetical protein
LGSDTPTDGTPAEGTPGEGTSPVVRAILCGDLELARRFAAALEAVLVPCQARARDDGRAILAVPEEFGDRAWNALAALPQIEAAEVDGEMCLRVSAKPAEAKMTDHAVLHESAEDLLRRGAAALDDLERCLTEGNGFVTRLAWRQVGRLGRSARPLHERAILRAVRQGDSAAVRACMEIYRADERAEARGLPAGLGELRTLASDANPATRRAAVLVATFFPHPSVAVILADALLDADPMVAIEADDAFLEWGADDEGFDPELDPNEKKAIADKRRGFDPKNP